MVSLSDFNAPVEKPKLSDFFATGREPKPVLNPASINNVAAYTSSLVPGEQIENTYNRVTEDLNYGTSQVVHSIVDAYDKSDQEANYKSLVDVAADSSLSPDERALAIKNFSAPGSDRINRSFFQRTAMAASMSDSEPDDNDENEFVRVDATKNLDQVDEFNGWVQKSINSVNLANKPDAIGSLKNMVELMVPFLEQTTVAAISKDLLPNADGTWNGGNITRALTMMGDSKAQIRDAVLAMPLDKRKEFASNLIQMIQNTSGPTAFNPNNIIQMEQLESFLNYGYSDEQQFMDNVFSVLDDTVLLGPFTKFIKGAAKGARALETASASAATIKRYDAAVKAAQAPEAVAEVADVISKVAPTNTPIDSVIDRLSVLDNAPSAMIADTRKVLGDALNGMDNVSVDKIIDNMRVLDNAPSEKIAETRQALTEIVGNRNKELDGLITDDVLQSTRDIIADKVISKLDSLDDAPYEVYQDIRAAINDTITPVSINSKTISHEVMTRVNNILENKKLTTITNKETGQVKSYITQAMQESNLRRRAVRSQVSPVSVSQAYKDSNPGKARLMHQIVVEDKTDKAANIMYGTNRTDAIANDVLPEVKSEAGSVRNKVKMDEAAPNPDKAVADDLRDMNGAGYLATTEKDGMRVSVKDAWRDVQGLVPRREMSTIGDTDRGVSFDVVYGPKDGGFSDPVQAIEQAKFGLKKYGVTDDHIEVLARNEQGEYLPTDDFSKKGNYLIRVKNDYEFSPADVVEWALTSSDKFWRMFDSVKPWTAGKSGGLAAHFIPSTTVVDRLLLDAASVSADRGAWLQQRLLQLGNEYAKKYKALSKSQKYMVDDYIVRANAQGLKFNSNALKALGMSEEAVDSIRSWKKVNDTLWHFENIDLNKTLKARGYQKYVDNLNHTDLIAKPVVISQTGDVTRVFDGEKIVKVSREDIRKVYEKGGTIARTRGSVDFEDDVFDFVIVDNNSATSYLRGIRDDEATLAYRDGHYTVRYTDPYFITKQAKGKDGNIYSKAIATAGDRKMAEQAIARLRSTDTEGVYGLRGDLKKGSTEYQDKEWESAVSGGRTSQRVRGQRLKNVGETESDLNKLHVEAPEESLINSIRSLSARTSHRDFITAAKQRFLNQFGDIVKDERGVPLWPDDIRKIGGNDLEIPKSNLADARATWRYIEAIDSGYVNLLDDVSKNFFKGFSDTTGRMGWSHLEKGGRALEKFGPSAFARKKAFRLLLASNPLRQLPVQALQALPVILATNPLAIPKIANQYILLNYLARGGDVNSFMKATASKLTGLTAAEANDLVKHYKMSGFEASVKANSLIRDDMKSLVDRKLSQKVRGVVAAPLNFTQKIGFEAGENMLMRSVWLSEYDRLRAVKKGKPIGAADIEQLNAKVRHLTLNMNKAGELPYNENSFSALMQFFQAPHKAFSQVVMGHKGLTGAERAKLGTAYVLTYGIGANALTDMISKTLPEDSGIRDLIEGGMFNVLFNKALSTLYGTDVKTDFSDSLRLLQIPNIAQFVSDVWTMQIGEIATSSPSASLVFGDNARVTNFVKAAARPFTVNNDRKPEEFMFAGKKFLEMFSGASNIFKAKYILEHGQSMSASGAIVDPEINYPEALLKAGGFSTMDEARYYALNDKLYNTRQQYKDDIDKLISETSRNLASKGISNTEQEYYLDMMAEAQRVYKNDPFYMQEFSDQIMRKAKAGDYDLYKSIMSLASFVSEDKIEELIRSAPSSLKQDQIDTIRAQLKILHESD